MNDKQYQDIQSNLNVLRETILRLVNALVRNGTINERDKDLILWGGKI